MIIAETTPPPKPRSIAVRNAAWVYGAILVAMAVGQLFSFEKFIPLIESFGLAGGHGGATLLTALIVVTEVFAIPFLIRMYVSPLMRVTSMIAGLLAAMLWLYMTIAVNLTENAITNIGFFGTKVPLHAGWWTIVFALVLLGLAGWTAWGLRGLSTSRKPFTK